MKAEGHKASPRSRIAKVFIWLFGLVLAIGLTFVMTYGFLRVLVISGLYPNIHHKTNALAVCNELEQGVNRFYDDNGTVPIQVDRDSIINLNSADGIQLLRVLLGQEDDEDSLNHHGIKYLSIKEGKGGVKNGVGGMILDDDGLVLALCDPWGGSYWMALDGDFDEEITVQPKAAKKSKMLQRRVAVWSDGKNPEKAKDDVTTW